MPGSVLIGGARTPIGKLLGALTGLSAPELGAAAIAGALDRAGLAPDRVGAVVMGTVVQAGVGPNPARQAAVSAGLPMSVPATTVNKLCLSGLHAVAMADLMVSAGLHDVVVCGGMESMTRAPHLLSGARTGYRYGPAAVLDALDADALVCALDGVPMGAATDRYQAPLGISRQEQDAFAARSHHLAAAAAQSGRLAAEIVPVTVSTRRGDTTVTADEGIRADTTAESLARLRPAFDPDGTITAGSASQLSDGACALVVTSRDFAERHGLAPLAEIGAYGTVAGPDPSLLAQPANAVRDALARDGSLKPSDLDLLEINEAFAGVVVHSTRELGVDPERVNVNGGAIALGHPVGMSGARLVLSLVLELRRRGGGTGVAALCGGGGQGDALLLRSTV
ncbi:acetyl-CoA C-acetyltransferase [Streptomyces sp. SAI-135]|jgi:acetyl-CoA C-acetyltransferase|uniref:acetyl-CoA C-acetyltransferase n=1 Tax=unclassified Streptomyces TaxID=2593676 RepID=UPI00247387A5|nr:MULTISPECIES: acetyl-CoA C-acetyltransferase [unclassified Streptomyces]MDH6521932.1 acetyl-CoA C-acetyltransferase [Streptomyces sp. SAI-090]MDH6573301.1 acetyl-CoA C-acetyltransferase [Streptomyces sp. SAI-117]MDH6613966.1 acetyl-CoA C-acetyltransferase [Streptomyces sp. SAI-135]